MPSASADATLLAQARLGRTDAFEALVLRHQGLVCAITFSMLGDRDLSEDVAQETFIAAWRARDEVREPDRFRGWLCTTARNLALKARRRLGRTAELPDRELADDHVGPEDGLAARESEAIVWRALEAVPAAYREPLVLYYREGRSAAQVAEQLGLTVAAVEQRLSRGRRYLKQEVEELVERTLERSRPSAGFAAGVIAALPRGPAAASEPASETMTTDTTRSGSTTTMMKIAKALALAGAMSGLGIAAHAAITTEERVGSAPEAAGTERASASMPAGSERDDARADHGRTLVAGSDREGSDAARAGDEAASGAEAAVAPETSDYVITRLSATQVAVELAGGPSRLRSGSSMFGLAEPEAPAPVRTIRGRVLDQAGQPVASAVVVVGKRLSAMLSTSLSAQAGTTTGPDGSFALETWETKPLTMLAMHRSGGWSPVAPVAEGSDDLTVELRLGPTATLEGTITRGGAPLEAEVMVTVPGSSSFRLRVRSDAQGRYRIDRLPAGELEVSTWMPHDAGLGSGSRAAGTVSLAGGTAGRLDLDLPTGSHVTVEAEVPEGAQMMQYVLLMGEHAVPDAATLARLRKELPAGQTRQLLYGGIDLDEVMQWSDVPAGKVTFCVEALATKDEQIGMACTVSEVKDAGEGVHEVRLVVRKE